MGAELLPLSPPFCTRHPVGKSWREAFAPGALGTSELDSAQRKQGYYSSLCSTICAQAGSISTCSHDVNQTLLQAQHGPRLCHPQSVHCDDPEDTSSFWTRHHSIGGKTAFSPKKIILREDIESLLKKNSDCTWDWSGSSVGFPQKSTSR
ncbi:BCL2/adenovirus E1B 19 kDa protein-interacting protein 3-like isoform X2 [Bos indicus]|uniref:BCL2/adenovirus E1B 19 kDa protein-interacting protein 3-like isoform X2 n=1 Tax=Bos indicus TaxID=9915 RepID=A0ABM4RHL8_BOSIN